MTTGIVGDVDSLAERVKFAVARLRVSQNEIDRRLGKDTGYVSRLLSRGSNPRTDTMQALAAALEVDYLWLSTGRGKAPDGWGEPTLLAAAEGVDTFSPTKVRAIERSLGPKGSAREEKTSGAADADSKRKPRPKR